MIVAGKIRHTVSYPIEATRFQGAFGSMADPMDGIGRRGQNKERYV
jgi:hypothetical protein